MQQWKKNSLKLVKKGAKHSIRKQHEVFNRKENKKAFEMALRYTKI